MRDVIKSRIQLVLALAAGVVLGVVFFTPPSAGPTATGQHAGPQGVAGGPHDHSVDVHAAEVWTCSMHPDIRLPGPGQCPICAMDLIPLRSGGREQPLRLSAPDRALAGIETSVVERRPVTTTLELSGRLAYDETVVSRVSSTVPGRIERLFVDVTGTPVRRGDHLLKIWSRELFAVQKELVDALARAESAAEASIVRRTMFDAARAAEDRLALFGMSRGQIDALKSSRTPSETLTLYAPRDGVVVERTAMPGQYVSEGTPLYVLADLSRLWVDIDVFESDLSLVREGQPVRVTPHVNGAAPQEARVILISPVVDEKSRSVRVRADLDNKAGKLKPGMLVSANIAARLDEHGHVVVDDSGALAYQCPMHPEVQSERPGTCTVCGMRLEKRPPAPEITGQPPLVIPHTAPLLTGRRAVVYVEIADDDGASFEGREVKLGPRTTQGYVVLGGLFEGERIVTKGAFKVDAAMQIEARPSMLRPDGLTRIDVDNHVGDDVVLDDGHAPPEQPSHEQPSREQPSREQPSRAPTHAVPPVSTAPRAPPSSSSKALSMRTPTEHAGVGAIVDAYGALEDALTADDKGVAARAALTLIESWNRKLPGAGATLRKDALTHASALKDAKDIDEMRRAFTRVSDDVIALVAAVGPPTGRTVVVNFCPMARNDDAPSGKGARWIEDETTLSNPYFGAKMLRCGEEQDRILVGDAP